MTKQAELAYCKERMVNVDLGHAHAIDSTLSDVELASFPCSYSTAENMLTRSAVSATDVVLVTGASGGVGSAAIQLAKARGARVIAVTSSSKAEALLALGADRTVDRSDDLTQALGKDSVDVVIDLVAGPPWPGLFGCTVLGETVFENLVRRIEAGDIKPLVAQTFLLDQIREAQTQFETKAHVGKLVIAIDTTH